MRSIITRYEQRSFVAVSSPVPPPSSARASLFTDVVQPFSASVDFLDDSKLSLTSRILRATVSF